MMNWRNLTKEEQVAALQQVAEMRMEDDETMGIEEARAMVHAAIHEEYAKA